MDYDVVIVGGGAGGFFSAINIAEKNAKLKVCIVEKSPKVLAKVKISGGGRCNFTHACYDPKELIEFYPRGKKELLGPFNKFASGDTLEWFGERGIDFYETQDGSIFPSSDDSQTIIDCFLQSAEKSNIDVFKNQEVVDISRKETWQVKTKNKIFYSKSLVVATGSNTKVWDLLSKINHNIIDPIPSLFTFKIKDERINELMGLVVENAEVSLKESVIDSQQGPLLITHWGMSGPSILKLSSFGARELHSKSYQSKLIVNFIPDYDLESMIAFLESIKTINSTQYVSNFNELNIPSRLWKNLVKASSIKEKENWSDITNVKLHELSSQLTEAEFNINGRFKFKDEFVTAGGVNLKEVDFRTFESKVHDNLYFAGEVLDIDAVTGGFNFQNAWTGGWVVSESISKK